MIRSGFSGPFETTNIGLTILFEGCNGEEIPVTMISFIDLIFSELIELVFCTFNLDQNRGNRSYLNELNSKKIPIRIIHSSI